MQKYVPLPLAYCSENFRIISKLFSVAVSDAQKPRATRSRQSSLPFPPSSSSPPGPAARDRSGMYDANRANVRATEDPEHTTEAVFDSAILGAMLALAMVLAVIFVAYGHVAETSYVPMV